MDGEIISQSPSSSLRRKSAISIRQEAWGTTTTTERNPPSETTASSATITTATSSSTDVTFLLSEWSHYGLFERMSYHLQLTTTSTTSPAQKATNSSKSQLLWNTKPTNLRRASCPMIASSSSTRRGSISSLYSHDASSSNNSDPALAAMDLPFMSSSVDGESARITDQQPICGVVCLLEFLPPMGVSSGRTTKNKSFRRMLRTRIRAFNVEAFHTRTRMQNYRYGSNQPIIPKVNEEEEEEEEQNRMSVCYQPTTLPIPISSNTRVTFAYNKIRMVLCLDASPSLIQTFSYWRSTNRHSDNEHSILSSNNNQQYYWWEQKQEEKDPLTSTNDFCLLDNVPTMVERYLLGLVEPITLPNGADWSTYASHIPDIFITVVAVYSQKQQQQQYFCMDSNEEQVEDGATKDLLRHTTTNNPNHSNVSVLVRDYVLTDADSVRALGSKLSEWTSCEIESGIASRLYAQSSVSEIPPPSSVSDLLEACEDALSRMTPSARPCITLISTCSSLLLPESSVADYITDSSLRDVPVHVLDLSSVDSIQNCMDHSTSAETKLQQDIQEDMSSASRNNGRNSLIDLCTLSGGCFLDKSSLFDAIATRVGQVPPSSQFSSDPYITGRRRSMRPNVLQWYTLFEVSHLSPLNKVENKSAGLTGLRGHNCKPLSTLGTVATDHTNRAAKAMNQIQDVHFDGKEKSDKIILSTYVLSPVRLSGLLHMRFLEGFRTKRYSQNAHYRKNFTFQLVLSTKSCMIHYELSYSASEYHTVGGAQVKIGLSGDNNVVQRVRKDFGLHQAFMEDRRQISLLSKSSSQICRLLRWIRKEDYLQSYLCPTEWLALEKPLFLRRLETITAQQCQQHFRSESFEVVVLRQYYTELYQTLLAPESYSTVYNEKLSLHYMISTWATKTISEGTYIKRFPDDGPEMYPSYCLIKILPCLGDSSLFSIRVFSFGLDPIERFKLLDSLKQYLDTLGSSVILPKAISRKLFLDTTIGPVDQCFRHESWLLPKDSELLLLIAKQRIELGGFLLISPSGSRLLFAKLIYQNVSSNPGKKDNLLELDPLLLQCVVDYRSEYLQISLYMEGESGYFVPGNHISSQENIVFTQIYSKMKSLDQLYGSALMCRTRLISAFETNGVAANVSKMNSQQASDDVATLIPYCFKYCSHLPFFKRGSGKVNEVLASLTEEFLLSAEGLDLQIAKLPIDPETEILGIDPGGWFVIRRHSRSLILAHFSNKEQDDNSNNVHRNVTFFIFCIEILYSQKGEGAKLSEINEKFQSEITELTHLIEVEHNLNFSRAPDIALRQCTGNENITFHPDDFAFCLSHCIEIPVASALIARPVETDHFATGNDAENNYSRTSFSSVIEEFLRPVPGISSYFYFCALNDCFTKSVFDALSSKLKRVEAVNDDATSGSDEDASSSTAETKVDPDLYDIDIEPIGMQNYRVSMSTFRPPPLYVKILLNGKEASLNCLHRLEDGKTLSIFLTVFKDETSAKLSVENLLPLHKAVALALRARLEAFVAAQTLNRLRYLGPSMSNSDIKVAIKCLADTDEVVTVAVPLEFVFVCSDSIAGKPSGRPQDEDTAFSLLLEELSSGKLLQTKRATRNTFIVTEYNLNLNFLQYWCLVNVRQRGCLFISVHHPGGTGLAQDCATKVQRIILSITNLVNQRLLLESLHRTKIASNLLIPESFDGNGQTESDQSRRNIEEGRFSCPLMFSTKFPLNHRCKLNQTIMSLESSVLHQFATNRKGVFCYKDENGNVFYMVLRASKEERTDEIELQVFGVESPGKSIFQLCRLLHKKVMTLGVENLSAVLAKNPYFSLLPGDIAFLRSYKSNSDRALEENICGSTFFHRLHEAVDVSSRSGNNEVHVPGSTLSSPFKGCDDGLVRYSSKFFSLFYNNTSTHLNPQFQSVSTLTSKGRSFSSQTGQGLALVNFSLLDSEGSPVEYVRLAPDLSDAQQFFDLSLEDLTLHSVKDAPRQSHYRLKIEVINTTLDISYVLKWIQLSLTQSLLSWSIERHLENSRKGIMAPTNRRLEQSSNSSNLHEKWAKDLENACPGILLFHSILDFGSKLPHPAICKVQSTTLLRGCIARVTIELLERAILGPIFGDGRKYLAVSAHNVAIFRSTELEKPHQVKLSRGKQDGEAHVTDVCGISIADQKSLDVEYNIVFGLRCQKDCVCFDEETFGLAPATAKVFREVIIESSHGADTTEFEARVAEIKAQKPSAFVRSLAFVLTVNRTAQTVLAYNWHPTVVAESRLQFLEIEREAEVFMSHSENILLRRCLGSAIKKRSPLRHVSKPIDISGSSQLGSAVDNSKPSNTKNEFDRSADEGFKGSTIQRIARPISIRRPKLIGASVDGAVQQALMASRARASTRPAPMQKKTSCGNKHFSSQRSSDTRPRLNSDDSIKTQESSVLAPTKIISSSSGADQISKTSAKNATPNFQSKDGKNITEQSSSSSICDQHASRAAFFSPSLTRVSIDPIMLSPRQRSDDTATSFITARRQWHLASVATEASFLIATLPLAVTVKTCAVAIPTYLLEKIKPGASPKTHISTFLKMYLRYLCDGHYSYVPFATELSSAENENNDQVSAQSYFLKKQIVCGRSKSLIVVEVVIKQSPVLFEVVGIVKVWLFPLLRLNSSNDVQKDNLKRQKASKATNEAILLEASVRQNIAELRLDSTVFNFFTAELERFSAAKINCDLASFLQGLYHRYPIWRQHRLNGLRHRLYKQTIDWTVLQKIANYESWLSVVNFLQSTQPAVENSNSWICRARQSDVLVGSIGEREGVDVAAIYFFIRREKVFDLYILIQADLHPLDSVFQCSNRIFQVRSDYVMSIVDRRVQLSIHRALNQIRRKQVWEEFRLDISSNNRALTAALHPAVPSLDKVNDLCEVAYGETILKPIVETVFVHTDAFRQINWRGGVLSAMEHDRETFSWFRSWSTPNMALITLVRLHDMPADSLVLFLLDRGEKIVRDIFVICKEKDSELLSSMNDDDSTSSVVPRSLRTWIIRVFSDWLMRFIWKDLRIVEVLLLPDADPNRRRIFPLLPQQTFRRYTGERVMGESTVWVDN